MFNYSVKDLENNLIYEEEFIADQSYIMGKQEIITGLREALQLLKNGEIATFIFPSYKAYGIYGDNNKIPPNTAIICTIKVKSINSNCSGSAYAFLIVRTSCFMFTDSTRLLLKKFV